ncbi:MAG TPA: hypothetical protein VMB51_16525 [Solirubrobacteraceae bacterium]|nr:hypothetical protein [Solirubrobacteraceae bacterium]
MASLIRWEPVRRWEPARELDSLQQEVGRLFGSFFDTHTARPAQRHAPASLGSRD